MIGSGLRFTVFLAAAAAPARAQCLQWRAGFDPRGVDNRVEDCATYDDGSGPAVYFGGTFGSTGGVLSQNLARWNGSAWSRVGLGSPNGTVTTVASADDGSGTALFISGFFYAVGPVSANRIARWDGAAWAPLAGGLDANALALASFDDGSGPALYAGGNFTTADGAPASHVAKWNGSAWSALGSGTDAEVRALAVYDDGSGPALYAAGSFTLAGGAAADRIARWDGAGWTPLAGGGVDGTVETLAVFDAGSGPVLVAGGSFTSAGGVAVDRLATWNGSGWSDPGGLTNAPFGAPIAEDLAVHDDGSGPALFVVGWFHAAGGVAAHHVARWDGTAWSGLAGGFDDSNALCLASFVAGPVSLLCAAGDMRTAGGANVRGVAVWDGSAWAPEPALRGGTDGDVLAMSEFEDGSGPALFVGGAFLVAGTGTARHLARWDGASWSEPGGGTGGLVRAMAVFDDGTGPALFVGGDFTTAGGAPAAHVARWDGASWSVLGVGVDGNVRAMAVHDDGSGPALYVGGLFTHAGGGNALHVAKWRGGAWSAVGAGFQGTVHSFASFGGALYAGTSAVASRYIARWNGASWSDVGLGTNGPVVTLAVHDEGGGPALFAAGEFNAAFNAGGPVGTGNVARWNGSVWSALGGAFIQAPVYALASFDDGSGPGLCAGGFFPSVGGTPTPFLARWNGTSWSGLASGMSAEVLALATFDAHGDGTPDLYAGGRFALAGDVPAWHFAEWSGCGHTGTPLCFGDGSLAPCPCGNSGQVGRGCQNSSGTGGALLAAAGAPSLAADSLVLTSAGERPTALSIFLQGDLTIAPVIYGDGLRCTGGTLIRLYTRNASGGVVFAPTAGDLSVSARSAARGDPLAAGFVRMYQTYYRDPTASFCPAPPGNTWNVSNAVRIDWLP